MGIENELADALSRNNLPFFLQAQDPARRIRPTSSAGRHVDQQETRLDISSLEKDVQRYFEHGLSASTRRTYQAGINRFILFCNTYHICHPLPV